MNENPNDEEKLHNGIRSLWGSGDSIIPFALTQFFTCSSCTTEMVRLPRGRLQRLLGDVHKRTLASADLLLRHLKTCSSKVPLL